MEIDDDYFRNETADVGAGQFRISLATAITIVRKKASSGEEKKKEIFTPHKINGPFKAIGYSKE